MILMEVVEVQGQTANKYKAVVTGTNQSWNHHKHKQPQGRALKKNNKLNTEITTENLMQSNDKNGKN